jgi:DNA polymerase-3 subunit beta
MDITINRDALLKPLQSVSSVVEKKQTLPVLSNVLLRTKDGVLSLTGTDLEIELVGFVPVVSMMAEGEATVSARKLFDICRTLPESCLLRLALEKNSLIVRAEGSCFTLNTLPVQDFPNLENSEYPTQFKIKQTNLKNLFAKTYFAMGQQDVRHYLNGAFLDIRQNTMKCVAADGHRLALTSMEDEQLANVDVRVIVPRKSVLELIRLMGSEGNEDVTVQVGENRICVTTPDYIFTSKLINAQYPDYNRLIPKGSLIAEGDREAIKQALTRASILSNEKFRGVRFQLETNKLRITANNSDQEQAEEAVSMEYDGKAMEIGFNVAYLLDVVSSVAEKSIRFAFSDANSGVLIASADSVYVVMPMRL